MRKITIILAFLLLAPMLIQAQTRRALVIGLGQQEDISWNKINGDKDVAYVLEILSDAAFSQIITRVNEDATKAGIVEAFRTLEQSCRPNDIVYVHFSGHGQQVKDKNGDEHDGMDESWIPYDAYRKFCDKDCGEKHLIDDEINQFLNAIRNKIGGNGKMLVVVDACHSGGSTRAHGETARGVEDVFEASFRSRPSPVYSERWITLSACENDQINFEMKTPVVGKLTYAIYRNIKDGSMGSNAEFFQKLKTFINVNRSSRPQRPTMTGDTIHCNIADIFR